jgi:hypothetical protein
MNVCGVKIFDTISLFLALAFYFLYINALAYYNASVVVNLSAPGSQANNARNSQPEIFRLKLETCDAQPSNLPKILRHGTLYVLANPSKTSRHGMPNRLIRHFLVRFFVVVHDHLDEPRTVGGDSVKVVIYDPEHRPVRHGIQDLQVNPVD